MFALRARAHRLSPSQKQKDMVFPAIPFQSVYLRHVRNPERFQSSMERQTGSPRSIKLTKKRSEDVMRALRSKVVSIFKILPLLFSWRRSDIITNDEL